MSSFIWTPPITPPPTAWKPEDVGFQVLHEGTSEGGDREGEEASLTYYGLWENRRDFVKGMLGSRKVVGDIEGVFTIETTVPYQYPENPNLYAYSYGTRPLGSHTGDPTLVGDQVKYKWAMVDVKFKTFPFDFGEDGGVNGETYATESISVSGEYVTLPKSAYKFASDSQPIDQEIGRLVPLVDYTLTRHWMPFYPEFYIKQFVGRVNHDVLFGYPAQTILFLGADGDIDRDTEGVKLWTITYKFSYREVGWNKALRPDTGVFASIVNSASQPPYAPVDLTLLP